MNIPSQFLPAIEKGFKEAFQSGPILGHKVEGVRVVLLDGAAHQVDSNELSFILASKGAFKQAFPKAKPIILEPVMDVNVTAPIEYQGSCVALLNGRRGMITHSETENENFEAHAHVALNEMFGFSTDLRSSTQGKGEFSMTYLKHSPMLPFVQEKLIKEHELKKAK
jgi:elongation factor G